MGALRFMHSESAHSDTRTVINDSHHADGRGRKVMERAIDEVRRFLVMFLYLWLLFGLFALYQRILLRQEGLNFTAQGFALINALVLAKVMLIAEDLKVGHWLRSRPLIYPILGESLIFTVVFICFHIVEHVVIGLFKRESIASSIPATGGGGLAGLVSVALILFVSLIPFFAFRNLSAGWRSSAAPRVSARRAMACTRRAALRCHRMLTVVLRPAQTLRLLGAKGRRDRPVGPGHPPNRWLVKRPLPRWCRRQDAGRTLHHDVARIGGGWCDECYVARNTAIDGAFPGG